MANVGTWISAAVALGTLSLAAAAFWQIRMARLENRADFAKAMIDGVYGPLFPFRRKWRDKYWIYRGQEFKHWTDVRLTRPHITARMPSELVVALEVMVESKNQLHNLRNGTKSSLFNEIDRWAHAQGLVRGEERALIGVVPVFEDGHQGTEMDLFEVWALGRSTDEHLAALAKEHGRRLRDLVLVQQMVPVRDEGTAREFMRHMFAFFDQHDGAKEFRRVLDDAAKAGERAAEILEREVSRLTAIMKRAGS